MVPMFGLNGMHRSSANKRTVPEDVDRPSHNIQVKATVVDSFKYGQSVSYFCIFLSPLMGDINDYIPLWQSRHFGNKELSYTRCVESLRSPNPIIDVRRVGTRWLVCSSHVLLRRDFAYE